MSYILEALKKSEEEREKEQAQQQAEEQQASIPESEFAQEPLPQARPPLEPAQPISATTGHTTQKKSSLWIIIVITSMFLALAIVIVWKTLLQPSSDSSPATVIEAPKQPVNVAKSGHEPSPVKKPAATKSDKVNKPPVSKSTQPTKKKPAPKPEEEWKAPVAKKAPAITPKKKPPVAKKISPPPVTKPEPVKAVAQKPKPTPKPTPQPKRKVLNIVDLPRNIRTAIPDITFTAHVYTSQVTGRSVIINGTKMREGDFLNQDIRLEEITVKGAVFSYEGTWFLLGAMQDWTKN